jgi:hypothetical protein
VDILIGKPYLINTIKIVDPTKLGTPLLSSELSSIALQNRIDYMQLTYFFPGKGALGGTGSGVMLPGLSSDHRPLEVIKSVCFAVCGMPFGEFTVQISRFRR